MLSDALDITIESRGVTIWLFLSGPFNKEQISNIKTKIEDLIRDGNRQFVIDLEKVVSIHNDVAPMFLSLLNLVKGKKGDIKLIFKNEIVSNAFAASKNIFTIYPDAKSIASNNFFYNIWLRSTFLTKKTGIRVSIPVAIFFLFILTGWFVSLGIIINMQKQQIEAQEAEIQDYEQWKKVTEIEINELRNRIKPMVQLGLVPDSLSK